MKATGLEIATNQLACASKSCDTIMNLWAFQRVDEKNIRSQCIARLSVDMRLV